MTHSVAKLVFNTISLTAFSIHFTHLKSDKHKSQDIDVNEGQQEKSQRLIIYHFELFMSSSSQMGMRAKHAMNILIPSFINLGNDEHLCYSLQQIAAWLHSTY